MNKEIDLVLNALAHKQFGAVAREQAYARGIRADAVNRRVAWGAFRDATPRVIVSTSSPDSFEQRATIARLDAGPGAAVSVLTTLAFAKLPGSPSSRFTSVARGETTANPRPASCGTTRD